MEIIACRLLVVSLVLGVVPAASVAWRDARDYVALFAPVNQRASYAAAVSTASLTAVLAEVNEDAMAAHAPIDGRSVLVVRPDHERNVVSDALSRRGATVTDLTAYRTDADPPDSPAAQRIYRMLLDGEVDAVTFTSPTAVRRFASLVGDEQAADLLGTTVVACIGPVTAEAATQFNVKTTIQPSSYTIPALVDAIAKYFEKKKT